MQTLEGTQLGNYDVVRRIRVGGMGAVYEGRQRTAFGRRVAIKVILGNYASDREMRRRFAREARTIARLQHPHILPLYEFGDERGLLYLVMPFIEGGTLTSYLRNALPDLQDIATIFTQLLDAVGYAHEEGLIHRDIKSSNVLLDARRGGTPYAYLADFGLVRTTQNLEREESGRPIPLDQVPGTPHYMAPEQTRDIVTPATDIYALGVLLYQMLTGELPYDDADDVEVVKMHLYAPAPSPCERDASIPLELGEVVRKAMAKRPEQRFASAEEMRRAFVAAFEGPATHITEDDPEIELPLASPPQAPQPLPHPIPASPPLPPRPRRASVPLSRAELPRAAAQGRIPPRRRSTTVLQPQQLHQSPQSSARRRPKHVPRKKRRGRGRLALAILAAMLVPLVLLALLVLPRAFGVSLFPDGFPIFGASPVATISITVKSQSLQNSYLLMASPQTSQPNVSTRALPDRVLSNSQSGSKATAASGTRTSPGQAATGVLFFDNRSHQTNFEGQGTQFTASNGVQVMLSQSVTIPPRSDGVDGTASAPAIAVTPGANGNLPAGAINTGCCNGQITVSNPQPFSGGVDSQVQHVVTQADLDSVRDALLPGLQKQAIQRIQSQMTSGEVQAGPPGVTPVVSSDVPVGTMAQIVNVRVVVTVTATVYNAETARQLSEELLIRQATQQLGSAYILQGTLVVGAPVITSHEAHGVIFLSVTARGQWVYHVTAQDLDKWKQTIKGATLQLAQTFLAAQQPVASARIQLPFGADHLPTSLDQIQIVLVNV